MIFSFVLNFTLAFGFLKLIHRFEVCNDLDHYIKCVFFYRLWNSAFQPGKSMNINPSSTNLCDTLIAAPNNTI